jgi:hypothetical protein
VRLAALSGPNIWRRGKKELRRRRTAKLPALARHLGIDVDRFNLSPENGQSETVRVTPDKLAVALPWRHKDYILPILEMSAHLGAIRLNPILRTANL